MKVALLGAGTMGSFHAATLRAHSAVQELRIYDEDPSRATVASIEEALEGADAALVVTPAATHADLIRTCVDRGLPTFCEKPIAVDLETTLDVVKHVESARGVVQMGFQRRFDAAFGEARTRIRDGSLGRVHAFAMATFDRTPPPPVYIPTSGGLFKDMHIHDFDSIRWLFGQEAVEVTASGSVLIDGLFGEAGDVDTSSLSVRLADGTLGSLVGARANAAGYIARLDVYGAAGMHSVREDRPYRDFLDRYPDAYRAELAHFLRVAAGEAEVACTVRDGLEALRLAEAAGRSRREARTVRLAEVPEAD